jgi:single-stranded-DNA-specific exonuclease
MSRPLIKCRSAPAESVARLVNAGCQPLLARIYAGRGVQDPTELQATFDRLHGLDEMLNLRKMARLLADAIGARARLLIVADYDADGATACAVGIRALRAFGADVAYLVPNRFEFGYGLTPELARVAYERHRPDVLVTVDNGIASFDGVLEANRLGMRVLVTDHHLPANSLPAAWCIVNPNQPGCAFPSKHLAGVGVMFYVMLALRAELRARGTLDREPSMAALLDLVALGTVADVVRLDANNRVLVRQGLNRIRAGRMQPGVAALFEAAGRDPARACGYDLGFVLGPRLNAAGRLSDMGLGIECLISDDPPRASSIARQLDALNRERREIEAEMHESALAALDPDPGDAFTLAIFHPEWHQGVIGIIASRLRERFHRPVIAFARGSAGEIKGSGRSIGALHLRDALDLVTKRFPGLVLKFGGHAAAAGLTLRELDFHVFKTAFEATARSLLTTADLEREIETDGSLEGSELTFHTARDLSEAVWGHGFPEPQFFDAFEVLDQRTVGAQHLKLRLARAGRTLDAMLFRDAQPLPRHIEAIYRVDMNEFHGTFGLQLTLQHWHARRSGAGSNPF